MCARAHVYLGFFLSACLRAYLCHVYVLALDTHTNTYTVQTQTQKQNTHDRHAYRHIHSQIETRTHQNTDTDTKTQTQKETHIKIHGKKIIRFLAAIFPIQMIICDKGTITFMWSLLTDMFTNIQLRFLRIFDQSVVCLLGLTGSTLGLCKRSRKEIEGGVRAVCTSIDTLKR